MKLLVLLNEHSVGEQDDRRSALNDLKTDGTITHSEVYSFPVRERELRSWPAVLEEIANTVDTLRPDAILWSHVNRRPIEASYIKKLRNSVPHLAIGHFTADAYTRWFNPMPRSLVEFCRHIDVCFWPGLGSMIEPLQRAGCRDIRYVPCGASIQRFFYAERHHSRYDFDVVMIGNRVIRRLPFRRHPGQIERELIVRQLAKYFGGRFAVFGEGWRGKYAQGPVPFKEQAETYRRSHISIGTNNFNNIPYYFSNRLPIALISGIPHVTREVPGLKHLFTDGEHCVFFHGVCDALDKVVSLLEHGASELQRIGNNGAKRVREQFSIEIQMRFMVRVLYEYVTARLLGGNWPKPGLNLWVPNKL